MEPEIIPCFLCGGAIEVRNSKKNKPYFICDPCGLQAFIRRDRGVDKLKEWMEGKGEAYKKKSGGFILELVANLEALKAKLKEVEDKQGLLFLDKDKEFIISSLKAEMDSLKAQIRGQIKSKANKE